MADSNKRQRTLLSFFAMPKQNKAADQLCIAPHPGQIDQDNKEAWHGNGVALARGKQEQGLSVDAPPQGHVALKESKTDQKPTLCQPLSEISLVDTVFRAELSTARNSDKSDKQQSSLLLCVDSSDPAASVTDNEGSLNKVNMNAAPSSKLENVNVYEQQVRSSVWSMLACNCAGMLFCTRCIVGDKLLVIRAEASAHSA